MKLDILAFGAHPDDVEFSCGGLIAHYTSVGKKVGIVDLTRGELGTRGTADIRDDEAAKAAKILNLSARDNLNFRDGFFVNDEAHQLAIIRKIRHYQPDLILANAPMCRHPDHGRAAELVKQARFLSGLAKIDTGQAPWRPGKIVHYIQGNDIKPDFIMDITDYFDTKMKAIKAYSSQIHNPNNDDDHDGNLPETIISNPEFLKVMEARACHYGFMIGARFGEGYIAHKPLKINDPLGLI